MPRRPPKKWWDRCVKKLKGKVKDPRKVCGWIWYHHAKPETKRRILREENPRWIKAALKAIKSPKTPAHLKKALKKKLMQLMGKENPAKGKILVSSSHLLFRNGIEFFIGRKHWDTVLKAIRIGKRLPEGELRIIEIGGEE